MCASPGNSFQNQRYTELQTYLTQSAYAAGPSRPCRRSRRRLLVP